MTHPRIFFIYVFWPWPVIRTGQKTEWKRKDMGGANKTVSGWMVLLVLTPLASGGPILLQPLEYAAALWWSAGGMECILFCRGQDGNDLELIEGSQQQHWYSLPLVIAIQLSYPQALVTKGNGSLEIHSDSDIDSDSLPACLFDVLVIFRTLM